jgi:hypothetical protein
MKVILNASKQPYCNVAVWCGGAKINNVEYFYVSEHDALMTRQVYGKHMKLRKKVSFNQFLDMVNKDDYTFEQKEITRFKPDMFDGQ